MYRRPKFLEILLAIREEMAREADYDPDLFAEMVRAGLKPAILKMHDLTDPKPVTGKPAAKPKGKGRRVGSDS